ncbi:MAG: type IV toxin-antitoxin system AbiEi family antitoxin domain-containing protein, partial [Solirubrobacteraceae bacterium]
MAICHVVRAGEGALSTVESVAVLQAGLIHRRQLGALGFGRGAVARRVRSGRLDAVFPSVFAVAGRPLDELARCYAALLHVGDDGVLSHGAAAAIWGLLDSPPSVLRATVVVRHVRDPAGLRVHRVRWLDARDVRMFGRLPVTTPARTLIDLAADSSATVLEEALARARARGLVTDHDIDGALERAPLRTGVARLRRLRADPIGQVITRSRFERDLIRLLRVVELPLPECDVAVNGHLVDAVWHERRLVLECDGWDFHNGRRS